jgi:hypothetical protein
MVFDHTYVSYERYKDILHWYLKLKPRVTLCFKQSSFLKPINGNALYNWLSKGSAHKATI